MRKWVPSFSEIIDRLSIHQMKEVLIPQHKDKYYNEMMDMVHDLDTMIAEHNIQISGHLIHSIVALSQINAHIWYNEASVRSGETQDLNKLRLTHGLNGIRSRIMNLISDAISDTERKDYKADCLAAEFSDWKMGILSSGDM